MNSALGSYYNNIKFNKHNVKNSVKNTIHENLSKNLSNEEDDFGEDY